MNIYKVRTVGLIFLILGFIALIILVLTQNPYPQYTNSGLSENQNASPNYAYNSAVVKILLALVVVCVIVGIFFWVYQKNILKQNSTLPNNSTPFKKTFLSVGLSVILIVVVLFIFLSVLYFYELLTITG